LPTFKEKEAIYTYHFIICCSGKIFTANTESEGLDAVKRADFNSVGSRKAKKSYTFA
jgi:hypothetical protein